MPDREPRVVTQDVKRALERVIKPDDPEAGESVSIIAEKAGTSTRTVYRILSVSTTDISLDLADRLLVASGGHLIDCRLIPPDG